ncbi:MAG: class I SAM-dependent methyltransferase [Chloroflexi bacterium]|nr:class I SAM-dependent methyltransferase [Chloroflexota bacterium]
MSETSTGYRDVLDPSRHRELERLQVIQAACDPASTRWLQYLGVAAGWHCLEVGAGGGSIAAWLVDRVGPTGTVLATDLRVDQMAGLVAPNLQVRVHDVGADPLDEAAYDLVHLRFVLQHLPDRARVLRKLIAALRPGGWLLVEEADYGALDASIGELPAQVAVWYHQVQRFLRERLHIDNYAGRRLLTDLLATGLTSVGSDGSVFLLGPRAPAVSPEFVASAFEQALPVLEGQGLARAEGEGFVHWMRRPDFSAFGPIQMAAWGQRPPAAASSPPES